jgi:hypothetical protein
LTRLVGEASPASTTDAAVSDLNVDPGSKGAVNAREPRSSESTEVGAFGSTVGTSATASSRPVFASITVTVAHSACVAATCSAATRCTKYCRSASMVSWRSPPSRASETTCCEPGIVTQSVRLRNERISPFSAARQRSSESSRPASASPSSPMNPMRLPATAPFGYRRLGSV